MRVYGSGVSRAGVNTANTAYFNLSGGTTNQLDISEIKVAVVVAPTTAPEFYLSRATARGTQTATITGQALDPADPASFGTLDSTWSVNPTFSTTNWIDIGALAVTAGGIWVWTFYDQPLVIPATAGAGICLVNAVASGATLGTFAASYRWQE